VAVWLAVASVLDVVIALCAAFNSGYFAHYLWAGRARTAPYRVAALALLLVSLGTLGERLVWLAALAVADGGTASLPWALARLVTLAGTGLVSVLVVRRIVAIDSPYGR
jgi:hypothetical protein